MRAVFASSAAVALVAMVVCALAWGWHVSLGLAIGWLAAAGSLALNARVLPGVPPARLQLRILALALLKWPVLVVLVFFAGRLGPGAAVAFVFGACSVYFALAAGAKRSLRSHE